MLCTNISKIKASPRDQWRQPMGKKLKLIIKDKNKKTKIYSGIKARGNKYEKVKSTLDYNKIRNKVRLCTRRKRKQFETYIAKQAKTNTNIVWQYIKSDIKRSSYTGNIPEDPLDVNSRMLEKDIEMADIFNKYVLSIQSV